MGELIDNMKDFNESLFELSKALEHMAESQANALMHLKLKVDWLESRSVNNLDIPFDVFLKWKEDEKNAVKS